MEVCTPHFTSYVYKKLLVACHGVFKKKLNLPRWASNSTLFVSHNVPSFQEVIRRNAYSFYTRVAVCINILVAYVINNIYSEDSTLQKRCHYLLHWNTVVFCFLILLFERNFTVSFFSLFFLFMLLASKWSKWHVSINNRIENRFCRLPNICN